MVNDVINILFSSDDNYAQHLGASVYSLLSNNKEFSEINVYIIDNGISETNRKNLATIESEFANAKFIYIDFTDWKNKLSLNMSWNISISAYARLFVDSMLPKTVDRLLYLDCDMIVCGSLAPMWTTDLNGKVLGAVQDTIGDVTKSAVGLVPEDRYFNSGMLLIDMEAWRAQDMDNKCLSFINDHNGNVTHHDQGVLNGVLRNNWHLLNVENNLMTIHYVMSYGKTLNYFGEHASFYRESEVEAAKLKPVILHYTPSFTTRPWVGNCAHPLKNKYWEVLAKTPWKNAVPQKDNSKWYVRLINWRYRVLG